MLGCEGKIEIPISPKEIFVTFGEIKFLFGVIEITFGETQEARFPPFSCFLGMPLLHTYKLIQPSIHRLFSPLGYIYS